MRLGSGGSADVNLLQTDAAQYRNIDFSVLNDLTYMIGDVVGSSASAFAMAQIKNPVGSGIDVLIDQVVVAAAGTCSFRLSHFDTDFPTDNGAWINGRMAGPAGQAHSRHDSPVALVGTTLAEVRSLSQTPQRFELKAPLLLVPGEGVVVQTTVVNITLWYYFFGREV